MYVQRNFEARLRVIYAVEKEKVLHVCVCARARACVFPEALAYSCPCAHVALLIQQATLMFDIVTSFVVALAPPAFSTLSHTRHDFGKNFVEHKIRVLIFSTTFVEMFLILRII
jgi:hypothetical protein